MKITNTLVNEKITDKHKPKRLHTTHTQKNKIRRKRKSQIITVSSFILCQLKKITFGSGNPHSLKLKKGK